jgi:hypothetical protein
MGGLRDRTFPIQRGADAMARYRVSGFLGVMAGARQDLETPEDVIRFVGECLVANPTYHVTKVAGVHISGDLKDVLRTKLGARANFQIAMRDGETLATLIVSRKNESTESSDVSGKEGKS